MNWFSLSNQPTKEVELWNTTKRSVCEVPMSVLSVSKLYFWDRCMSGRPLNRILTRMGGNCIPCRISIQVSTTDQKLNPSLTALHYWWRYRVQRWEGPQTCGLALSNLAGTAYGTRATLQWWLWSPADTEEQSMFQFCHSSQLQPTTYFAPKQWDIGTFCSTGDKGMGKALISAEDRGVSSKPSLVPAKRLGGAPLSPAF